MYGKVDADSIERIEVVRGPSSVLWGSNAFGGAVNFVTKSSPFDYTIEGHKYGARSKVVYGSAADEFRLRQEVYGATPQFRYILGGSARDVNDVDGGRGVGVQRPTGGEDRNWDMKLSYLVAAKQELTLAVQDVYRSHIHRFYRPTQDNFNYRTGLSLSYRAGEPALFWDSLELKSYYQYKEDRRRWLSTGDRGVATTKTFQEKAQFTNGFGAHSFTYGMQIQRDYGESADDEQFTMTFASGLKKKDGPDTVWDNYGFYAQDEWSVYDKLTFVASFRHDRFLFESNVDDRYQPPGSWNKELDDFTDTDYSFVGGLGAVYNVTEGANLVFNYSRGYRLWPPKFGATQHGYGVVVPTMGFLDPITGDTYELGMKLKSEGAMTSAFVYYTDFDKFQVIEPGLFQGSDWFDFDGDGVRDANEGVYVVKSVGDAYVYGAELDGEIRLDKLISGAGPQWLARGGFAWNIGKVLEDDQPIRHTIPANGRVAVRWESSEEAGTWAEAVGEFVRKYSRIPDDRIANDPGYRSNPQDMTSALLRSDGHLPGYSVFHIRCGTELAKDVALTFAVENAANKKFRRAHSRWDESGTNILVGITAEY